MSDPSTQPGAGEGGGGDDLPPPVVMSPEEARRLNEVYARERVEYATAIGRPVETAGRRIFK